MLLPSRTRFGSFEVVGLIGTGGMGEVYRARDTKLDRDVALKVLPVRLLDEATGKSRVLHSLRLASLGPGLSVSPDGKTVLVSAVAEITQDLMRIENFR